MVHCPTRFVRNTVRGKYLSQNGDSSRGSGLRHFNHFCPFQVGINNNKEGLVHEGTSKVDVNPLPGSGRPTPGVQGDSVHSTSY